MRYEGMLEARFLSRPNRFVAMAELQGQQVLNAVLSGIF